MLKTFALFLFLLANLLGITQINLSGTWEGILIRDGYKFEQGTPFMANFTISGTTLEGRTRDELFNQEYFAVKKIKGSLNQVELSFKQIVVEKKKSSTKTNWCLIEGKLKYDSITGYLSGKYSSTDCKNNNGKIILYRTKTPFNDQNIGPSSHIWFTNFQKDYKKGYNAPEIREKERKNFVFEPIYFDYDKAEVRPEYKEFLIKMIRVVDGHSDLRIKVTGNTDSDGSEAYNLELSKRRAQALIDFFVSNGLSKDRIEIDFKGETNPIDTNNTPEGKQRNRRVDFSFI